MNRNRLISVPKDAKAMEDYNYGQQLPNQMDEWLLSQKEYDILSRLGVFRELNAVCDILIDDYEEEIIPFKKLTNAKDTLEKISLQYSSIKEVKKLQEMVTDALSHRTLIAFDF